MSTIKTTDPSLKGRLRQLRLAEDMTQAEIADEIGKSQQAWGRYEKGDSTPSVEVLQRVVERFDVNPTWLLVGEGVFMKPKQPQKLQTPEQFDPEDVVRIPIYEDALGAGPGGEAQDDIVAYGTFFRQWLRGEIGIQPDRAFIAPVHGRSMEDLLTNGDLVLCERAEQIRYEDIYVCRYEGELKVKHAHKSDGTITLRSENDRYPPLEVGPGDEFAVIGRVVRRVVR